ncbi:MAG: RhlB, TDP-rhamnosyltransferase 1 [Gemmataceae bacterium]|nr:RhlB, TDP-rhamnosyltransferase 1 [Gemmataceae bacterium]
MRVLLAPLGSHGDVHPFLGLGLALRARGHEVHFITSAAFRGLVERNGFPFAPVGTEEDYDALTRDPDLWHPSRSLRAILGRSERLVRFMRDGYKHIAEQYRPGETVLVAGALAFWARVANEKPGIPLATVHLQPGVIPSSADPPEFASLRMRAWWPRWFRSFLFWFGDHCVLDPLIRTVVNDFRRGLGLSPVRRVFGKWVHSPQLMIGLFPQWYGNAPDWPPQTRLAGFVRYDQAGSAPVPPAVETFLTDGEPPVVVTFGSAMRQGKPYFAAAAEACTILGKRGLLLARGGDQIPADLPPTVRHADYAPFSEVFPRAAAVVHHGGIGTCAQGLAAGVPQLVMPLAFDQPDNARRLERLGVGARVWPKRFTGPAVAAALRGLLSSPAVAARCREIAGWTGLGNPADEACRLIESLAGRDLRPAGGVRAEA